MSEATQPAHAEGKTAASDTPLPTELAAKLPQAPVAMRCEARGVKKSFGATSILKGVDLEIPEGTFAVLVGPSGCGKSTLLRLVAGLEEADEGTISLAGRDVTHAPPRDRDVAMVFQDYALYPHLSARENIALGLRLRKTADAEIKKRVAWAAEVLGLGPLLDRKPKDMSGGQRRRVAIGRAMVREPSVFLFDEPLSNLDAKLRVQMRGEIKRLQRRMGVTSLYVTHDQVEAMTLSDRLLVLHGGVPVQLATPIEVFEAPADTYVAGFIGTPAMNLWDGVLCENGAGVRREAGLVIPFADGRREGPEGRKLSIGVRPEDITVAPGGLKLHIDLVEQLGSETVWYGRFEGGEIVAVKVDGRPAVGDSVEVGIPPRAIHVFDAGTGLRLSGSA